MAARCIEYWAKDFTENNVYHNQTLSKMDDGRYVLAESTKAVNQDVFWNFVKPEEYTGFIDLTWTRHRIWNDDTLTWVEAPLT